MQYIKNNFNNFLLFLSELKKKNIYVLSAYLFSITFFSSFFLYFSNNLNIDNNFLNVFKAFFMYFFTIVLPLGGVFYYHKNEQNRQYIKNLKYVIFPLFKIKTILYFLLSFFFISFLLMLFFKFNHEIIEFAEISKDLMVSQKVLTIDEILPYLQKNNSLKYEFFIEYFNSYKFSLSLVSFILIFGLLFSIFFLSIIEFYVNETSFIFSIKKSLKLNFSNIFYIFVTLLIFLLISDISSEINKDNYSYLMLFVLIKSFSYSILIVSYYLLVINNENTIKNNSENDPYNTSDI